MIVPGEIVSYTEMCLEEGYSLQRGMNFQVHGGNSVILMSRRKNAPYTDRIEDNGRILIYEGHDVQKNFSKTPRFVDQPRFNPSGNLTQNGKFEKAALQYKKEGMQAELVKVYEKIKQGIWVYNGVFELIDVWLEKFDDRKVFKFKMKITNSTIVKENQGEYELRELTHNRLIPTAVKLEVWRRDKGKCVKCGSNDNLHFDHIIPFSKGGTSLKVDNIQLLCARHNLEKRDKIL